MGTVEERIQQRAEKKLYLDQMVNRGSLAGQAAKFDGAYTPTAPNELNYFAFLPPDRPC